MKEITMCELLSTLFLFRNVSQERIEELARGISPDIKRFSAGELIYSPDEFKYKIGFVIKGACTVERQRGDGIAIPLNLLECGDAFGVLGVFSQTEEFPTFVRAKKESTVLFLEKDDALFLIKNEAEIALNTIYFLGNRIAFLNNKISTFSADNIEQKVAKFLIYESRRSGGPTMDFNCKRTSEALNIGRASLYRAIDSLSQSGIIKFENKKINITDLEGLERITK